AKEEAYAAQREAEEKRAEVEMATQKADIIVKAQIEKEKAEIAAEAEAEVLRRKARGEADALYAKMEAEARGAQEILQKQAEGMRSLIEAAGDADSAVKMVVADKLEELMRIQVDAIKNIKIDKVTVWDGGKSGDGNTATADFIAGMMKAVPPLNEVFKQAGMELPALLGKELAESDAQEKNCESQTVSNEEDVKK
ncbi:MAG: flotillin family protein, partial [Oscillospiraceae bacterium]|nr:flotillin family protein [Oscillospiraceae bacterium]